MSKFRMKLKLQGFELEIEGNREDASVISRSIGEQVSSMISPSLNIVEGEFTSGAKEPPPVTALPDATSKKRGLRRTKSSPTVGERDATQAIELRNDPVRYATPTQQWSTSEKAIWILYVVKETTQIAELSAGQIAKTFNTHFRQAKTIIHGNVSRDLGKLKVSTPSLVGEDSNKSPSLWFLTEEGIRKVQLLIAKAQTPAAA